MNTLSEVSDKEVAVGYAYPTSPNAVSLGYKFGCYTVELVTHRLHKLTKPLGFPTKREAFEFADSLQLPFNRYSQSR